MRITNYFMKIDGKSGIITKKFAREDFIMVGDPVTLEYGMNTSSAIELVNRWNSASPNTKYWILSK